MFEWLVLVLAIFVVGLGVLNRFLYERELSRHSQRHSELHHALWITYAALHKLAQQGMIRDGERATVVIKDDPYKDGNEERKTIGQILDVAFAALFHSRIFFVNVPRPFHGHPFLPLPSPATGRRSAGSSTVALAACAYSAEWAKSFDLVGSLGWLWSPDPNTAN